MEPEMPRVAEPEPDATDPGLVVPADAGLPAAAPADEPEPPASLRRSTRACVVKPKPAISRSDSAILKATAYDGGADEEKELDAVYERKEEGDGSDSEFEIDPKAKSRKRKAAEMEAKKQAKKDTKEAKKAKDVRPAKRRRVEPGAGAGSGSAAVPADDDDAEPVAAGGDRLNPWDHRHAAATFVTSDLKAGSVVSMPQLFRVTTARDGEFKADTLRTGHSVNWTVTTETPIPGMIADHYSRTEKVTREQLADIFVRIPTNALDVFTVSFYPIANEDRVAEALENETKEISQSTTRKEFKAVAKRLLHPEAVTVVAQMKKAAQALGSSLIDKFKDDFADKEKVNWLTVYHDRLISIILRGVKYELK